MILADLARVLAVVGIGVLSVTGELELWHVIALVAVYGTGDAFFGPAFGAIVPDLVPSDELVRANSLNQLVEPIGLRLAGPALGGLAIAAFGVGEVFLLIGAAFVCSAAALALMRPRPAPARALEDRSIRRDLRDAIRFTRSQTWLWGTLCAAAVGLLAFIGPVDVLLPLVVKNDLGGGADDLGLVFAAGGVGAVIAALAIGHRGLPRRHITFMYAVWTLGTLLIAGFGIASALWQAMIVSFVMQAAFTSGLVVWATLMQRLVPPELRGRVSSFDWFVSVSLIPLSFALTGPVAGWVGIDTTLIGAGIASALVTAAFLFVPGMRDTERDGSLHRAAMAEENP
jgi:MFS family permease